MTTSTDQFGGFPPPPPPPPSDGGSLPPTGGSRPGHRVLRRSRNDRVAAGVAGGLGEYFELDPVLFRVLFATAAFFGGAGVLAYLIAWAAIPEQSTAHAPIDRFVGELRRRRVPVWLVAVAAGLALWGLAFSWWAPGHFFPVILVVIVLVAVFGRRGRRRRFDPAPPVTGGDTVDLSKEPRAAASDPSAPAWVGETRSWMREARAASRARRRRALPVRLATVGALVVVLGILAAIDAGVGIALPVYFWVALGIVLGGLLIGMALRRTPWSVSTLLPFTVVGLIAFGGTGAQLHDGFGQKDWTPTSSESLHSSYRLAFGQEVLDLSHVGSIDGTKNVDITLAAGQVRIILPPALNATVQANIHFGVVQVDGQDASTGNGSRSRGVNVSRTILPQAGATGLPVTINVHVADGNVSVVHSR